MLKTMSYSEQRVILNRLLEGPAAWNRLRRESADFEPDLRAANLKSLDFSATNLREARLNNADMRFAVFRTADFRMADLTEATMSEADFTDSNFAGAILRRADLSLATLKSTNLRATDLTEAFLHEADLRDANLRGAILNGADLRNANLRWADLRGADLSGSDLSGAVICGATLSGAKLDGARLRAAIFDSLTVWPAGHVPSSMAEAWESDSSHSAALMDFANSEAARIDDELRDRTSEAHGLGRVRKINSLQKYDLTFSFDPRLSPKQVKGTLAALADYYRSCGGLGFEIDLDTDAVFVNEPEYAGIR